MIFRINKVKKDRTNVGRSLQDYGIDRSLNEVTILAIFVWALPLIS